MQGMGWLTTEELWWNDKGELTTHAPSTYKIPTSRDWPEPRRTSTSGTSRTARTTIHRSKAVGEPPLMLAIAGFHALRDAVAEHRRLPLRRRARRARDRRAHPVGGRGHEAARGAAA